MKLAKISLALFLTAVFCGCETLDEAFDGKDEKNKIEYILSVHEIIDYPTGASDIEKEVPSFTGKTVLIKALPRLHSRNIEAVKMVEIPTKKGFFDLMLKLDRQGKIIWISLTQEVKMKRYGLLIDGVFYRTFDGSQLEIESQQDTVFLKGPFDQITALGIEKNAKKNFKHFQKGVSLDKMFK